MLISFEQIKEQLLSNNVSVHGSFHLGAHECEEIGFYNQIGLTTKDILWIDAIPSKVEEAKNKGIPNVYNAVITDKDDEDITFNISNNGQSSSILELGTHLQEHPEVFYIDKLKQKSITIDSFFKKNNLI